MVRFWSVFLAVALAQPAPHAFSQDAGIQSQAELELKQIDCEIMATSADVEARENALRALIPQMKDQIASTDAARQEALEAVDDMLEEGKDALEDLAGEAKVKSPKRLERQRKAYEKALGKQEIDFRRVPRGIRKFVRFTIVAQIYEGDIKFAMAINDMQMKNFEMQKRRRELVETGKRMDELSTEIAVTQNLVSTLVKSRLSRQKIWQDHGAQLDTYFGGDSCAANKLEGLWVAEPNEVQPDAPPYRIQIKGSRFAYWPGIRNLAKYCGALKGDLAISDGGEGASGTFRKQCQENSTAYGELTMKLSDEKLVVTGCMIVSYNGDACSGEDAGPTVYARAPQ